MFTRILEAIRFDCRLLGKALHLTSRRLTGGKPPVQPTVTARVTGGSVASRLRQGIAAVAGSNRGRATAVCCDRLLRSGENRPGGVKPSAVLKQLTSDPMNRRLVEVFVEAGVPFIVIGGTARRGALRSAAQGIEQAPGLQCRAA